MLYDARWDNPQPWTLEHLILWLGSKEGPYTYSSCEGCLLAQYAKELGYKGVHMGTHSFSFRSMGILPRTKILPAGFNDIAFYGHQSFPEAKKRAMELARTNALRAL